MGMDKQLAFSRVSDTNILVVHGDLTRQPVDAIVNAANESLTHGGGVAKDIVGTGGRVIQEESDAWVREHGPLGRGVAAVTTGGMLIASHVIHVVGPRYQAGQDNEAMLRDTVFAALDAAAEHEFTSVALPAISAGVFRYPVDQATEVIANAATNWLAATAHGLEELRLVGLKKRVAKMFAKALTASRAA